jgi:type VI secretion system secreted protein VgrG
VHVKGKVEETFDDTLTTTVANEIKMVCGASSITMKKDGTIEITGVNIKINGSATIEERSARIGSAATGDNTIAGARVEVSGSASVRVTGALIDSEAAGANTVKGALVKLNC